MKMSSAQWEPCCLDINVLYKLARDERDNIAAYCWLWFVSPPTDNNGIDGDILTSGNLNWHLKLGMF